MTSPDEHAALNRGAHGHGFIRVHILARLLAEQVLHRFLHHRHAGLAADQNDLAHILHGQARILQRNAAWLHGLLHQILDQGLELRAGQLHVQVLGARRVRRDVRQIDLGLLARGQLDLGLLGGFFQALHGQRILAHIDAAFLLELIRQVIDDAKIEVLAAQEGIAVGREHFELALAIDFGDLDHRHVEGAAAQVVHGDLAITAVLVEAIGQRRRRGLVDDALDVQARDAAGILGGLALRIVEIGRHRDDRFGDGFTEIILGGLFHLHEHARGDFRRRHFLALDFDPGIAVVGLDDLVGHHAHVFFHHIVGELAADEALDRGQGVRRIGDGLALGGLPHQYFAIFREGHDRRRGAITFAVLDNFGLAALHDRDARIRRAEIDANHFTH